MMGEGGHALEAEHRARALDRVQGAEGGVDQFVIVRGAVEVEQSLLELLQQFGRFLPVGFGPGR